MKTDFVVTQLILSMQGMQHRCFLWSFFFQILEIGGFSYFVVAICDLVHDWLMLAANTSEI